MGTIRFASFGIAGVLMLGVAACDNSSSTSTWILVAEWTTAAAYVAPNNGPDSMALVSITSSHATHIDATFELSLDGGQSFQPLTIIGTNAVGASIVGNSIRDIPRVQTFSLEFNTSGIGTSAPVPSARLRATITDGTSQGPNGNGTAVSMSDTFIINNTSA